MNDDLSKIYHWFETNQLTLNTKKTKIHYFGINHVLCNFNVRKMNFDYAAIVSIDI